jgi:tRNA-dihydrouridine synthase B
LGRHYNTPNCSWQKDFFVALAPLSIGSIRLEKPLALAPMAGVTNLPFRLLVKEQGVGLVCTETLSARGIVQGGERTSKMALGAVEERPLAAQIFGCDPEVLAEAAGILESHGLDIVDLNFGCPVSKFVRSFAGAVLMREPRKIHKILTAVRRRIRIPLTVKMRSGWDAGSINAPEIARISEACGVDAISIHPRTRAQGYTGRADWRVTAEVVQAVRVPVFGNGDVTSPERAKQLIDETGCAGIMIGRAALGNPWIFSQVGAFLETGTPGREEPDPGKRRSMMRRHLSALIRFMGDERRAVRVMRKHLGWYTKGLPGSALFRDAVNRVESRAEIEEAIEGFFERLAAGHARAPAADAAAGRPTGTDRPATAGNERLARSDRAA